MKVCQPYIPLLLVILVLPSISSHATEQIEAFVTSHSFSNILPIQQLVADDWQQLPDKSATTAFTQNEVGLRVHLNNFSFSVSQRYDYFVATNNDTANAFYLNRQDKALDTQAEYKLNLKLLHQRSNGIKIGYKLDYDNFSSEIRVGYWHLSATRESHLNGILSSDLNGNISADAQLSEFYSANNILRRQNNNAWETDGSGITLDLHMRWRLSNNINVAVDLTDLYSDFSLNNTGFSEGKLDTNGTFINSVGGVAYVPLYSGVETSARHQFNLPKTININALYRTNDLAYLTHFTRQGDLNFYYLGLQFESENSTTRLLFDLKNTAPEIQYSNPWLTAYFSIDDTNINQAMLIKLGLNIHLKF